MAAIGNVATVAGRVETRERFQTGQQYRANTTISPGAMGTSGPWELMGASVALDDVSIAASSLGIRGGPTLIEDAAKSWYQAPEDTVDSDSPVSQAAHPDVLISHDQLNLQREFTELVRQWERERPRGSNVADMVTHPAYQRIIGKGPRVVPLLLAELERKPGHWFWALHIITGVDPVSPESQGRLKEMAADWLAWGREQGYRW